MGGLDLMGIISDDAEKQVISELIVGREKRRQIQNLSRQDLQRYLVRLYRLGFDAGADAVQKQLEEKVQEDIYEEEVSVDWEDVLKVISEVRGVGPRILQAIDTKLKEVY